MSRQTRGINSNLKLATKRTMRTSGLKKNKPRLNKKIHLLIWSGLSLKNKSFLSSSLTGYVRVTNPKIRWSPTSTKHTRRPMTVTISSIVSLACIRSKHATSPQSLSRTFKFKKSPPRLLRITCWKSSSILLIRRSIRSKQLLKTLSCWRLIPSWLRVCSRCSILRLQIACTLFKTRNLTQFISVMYAQVIRMISFTL